jgi:uncharacterized protein YacL
MSVSELQRLADEMKAKSEAVIERMHFEHVKHIHRVMEQAFRHGIILGIVLGMIGLIVGLVFGSILFSVR